MTAAFFCNGSVQIKSSPDATEIPASARTFAAASLSSTRKIMQAVPVLGVRKAYTYSTSMFAAARASTVLEKVPGSSFRSTASTGVILLREIDEDFRTPAADNMVYQNFPAIVFGFPMMLLATIAQKKPVLTLIILALFFAAMNVILFRRSIFGKKGK